MTHDLQALAREIARELAAGDSRAGPVVPNTDTSRPVVRGSAPLGVSAPPGVTFVRQNARIADFIDHTLLKPEGTARDIDTLCDEAREHRFAAVCVHPVWVARCAKRLGGSAVQVATVIGFPLGANSSATKRRESTLAVEHGATEVDMVAAIGHIKSGDWNHVADDIAAVVEGAGGGGALVKVIIESAALSPVEIIKACAIAREMRAHYVKTSTGFHAAGGASAEAVALMRLVVGDAMGVKASGGVRDCEAALRMIANGATRIGTSSGVSMAKCLGQGPLPLNDLLSMATQHASGCATCAALPVGGSTAGPY
ncbi:MAG: deoxyribose-phosphate aldolase [Gemmatimonadaceae bacterium]|nr:deoxyribose-phosphate aldolase [Gemmatimonadaceae bacterium]